MLTRVTSNASAIILCLLAFAGCNQGPDVIVSADAGGTPDVRQINAITQQASNSFSAFDASFTGGVRVAVGDVNGDGTADIIAGAGPGGAPHVKVFSGKDQSLLQSFFAFDSSFTGGVFVAAGDVNGDGLADIVVGADSGGGPHVKVFDGATNTLLMSFFAFGATFTGGVRVAGGDVDGDRIADIIVAAGPGGGPQVQVFSGKDQSLLMSFFAYDAGFTGGVYVAAGDITGDGRADIVTGAGSGGGPHVKVFDGAGGGELQSFFAFESSFTGGVRVAAGDVNGDGRADVITGAGPGAGPRVRIFDGATSQSLGDFFAFDASITRGVFIAYSPLRETRR